MKTKIILRHLWIPLYFLSFSMNLFSQAVVFEKTFHFSAEDKISDMVKLEDNNFILIGTTINNSGFNDILVIKVNSSGDTLFTRIFDFDTVATANKIISLSDENLIIAGAVGTQALLMKLNQDGDTLWSKTYSDEEKCSFQNVVEVSNTDLIVAEWIEIYPTTSKLLRLSNSGELISAINEADPGSSYVGLIRTPSDEIYLSGYEGESYNPNLFMKKYNAADSIIFYNSYNIFGIITGFATDGQNYFIGGGINEDDIWYPCVIKTLDNGVVEWCHAFYDDPYPMWLENIALDDEHRIFSIRDEPVYNQVKIDVLNNSNNPIGEFTYECNHPSMTSIIADNEYIYLGGSVQNSPTGRDACFIKIYADSVVTEIRPFSIKTPSQINIFPNPANAILTIEADKELLQENFDISIYDQLGMKVRQMPEFNISATQSIDVNAMTEGIYFMIFNYHDYEPVMKKFIISR
jgi:hypothetical protein